MQIDFLLREKIFDRDAARADPIQIELPLRGDVRKENFVGQYLAEGDAEIGRDKLLLLQSDVFALLECFDDGGACRLRPDPRALFELLFQTLVFDVFMNLLHRFQQCCGSKPRRRFRHALLHLSVLICDGITFMDAREILHFVRIVLAAALFFLIDCPPTVLQDDLAACGKNLCAGSDFDLRCEKFLRRIELRDV